MKIYKKIVADLGCLLLFTASVYIKSPAMVYIPPTYTDDVESGSAIEEVKELYIRDIASAELTDTIVFVPVGEIPSLSLPSTVYVTSSAYQSYICDVNWNMDTLDTSSPARTVLTGEVLPPNGYTFSGGLEPRVEIVVIVYDEESGEPNISAEYKGEAEELGLAPVGCDLRDYLPAGTTYQCETEYGDKISCDAVWESLPNTDTAGRLQIKGRLTPPRGIRLENDEITASIYLMEADDIYTDYIFRNDDYTGVMWIKEIEDYESITCEYLSDEGEWVDASDLCIVGPTSLYVMMYSITPGTSRKFRISYNGREYGEITLSGLMIDTPGGDKDMGDNGKQSLPELVLTTDATTEVTSSGTLEEDTTKKTALAAHSGGGLSRKAETTTEAVTEAVTEAATKATTEETQASTTTLLNSENKPTAPREEKVSSNKTVVSGERLKELAEIQGDNIAFEKDGLMLSIPSDIIEKKAIKPDDSFSVELERSNDKAKIDVRVNDEPVTRLDGAALTAPSGKTEPVTGSGEYDLQPIEEGAEKSQNIGMGTVIVLICTVFAAVAGGASILIFRKK